MTAQKTTRPEQGAGHHDPTSLTADPTGETSAEHAFAGSILIAGTPALAGEILASAGDEDLAEPFCRLVVATARRMHRECLPIDPVTLAGYVWQHGLLEPGPTRTRLASRLFSLANEAPVAASGTYYGLIVREHAACRTVAEVGRRLGALALGGPADLIEAAPALIDDLRAALARIEPRRSPRAVAA